MSLIRPRRKTKGGSGSPGPLSENAKGWKGKKSNPSRVCPQCKQPFWLHSGDRCPSVEEAISRRDFLNKVVK